MVLLPFSLGSNTAFNPSTISRSYPSEIRYAHHYHEFHGAGGACAVNPFASLTRGTELGLHIAASDPHVTA